MPSLLLLPLARKVHCVFQLAEAALEFSSLRNSLLAQFLRLKVLQNAKSQNVNNLDLQEILFAQRVFLETISMLGASNALRYDFLLLRHVNLY